MATGRAFCGVFGSDLRREYTLHGEVINLAARLMEVSRGEILCCDATAQVGARQRRLRRAEPVSLKGRTEPVAVHRAIATRTAREPPRVADGRARGRAAR